MIRKGFVTLFIALVVGGTVFLLNFYRHAAPSKYFYAFVALVGAFIIAEVLGHKFIKARFDDKPTITRLVDWCGTIVLGLVLYLFALFVYPGK